MQSCFRSHNHLSENFTDANEQYKKQAIALIFPSHIDISQTDLANLSQNLNENFILAEHRQYLVNFAYRNHNSESVRFYRKFLNEKCPEVIEPKISSYYANEVFPDLKVLGSYRKNPDDYSKRHAGPLQEATYLELDNIFSEFGYIPHLQRFLTFFPRYLQKQRVVQKELFEKSKIDQQYAYFLGLCAAAQMGCPYMINRMAIKFLAKGGKSEWIQNKKYSQKIASVVPLNRKLARCIWELNCQDFEEIVEGGFWNMNQLAFIIQILSFVHSLCIMTLGLGLKAQQRNPVLSTFRIQQFIQKYGEIENAGSQKAKKPPLKDVLPSLKLVIQQLKNNNAPFVQPKVNPKVSFRKQRKSSEEQENSTIQPYMKEVGNQLTEQKLVNQVLNELRSFLPSFSTIQKRRDNKNNQFTCVDFNFQFMAFPRLQSLNFVGQTSKKILALIKQAEEMGLQNFGSEMIGSTKQLRKAQRYYAQNLCGYSHPEYDYKKYMTNILTMPLKFYIRLLMLSPLHMKRQILDEINHEKGQIQLFDLGHTAILIAISNFKLALTLTTYYFDY